MPSFAEQVNEFIEAALPQIEEDHRDRSPERAAELLQASSMLAHANLVTACITGEYLTLQAFLRQYPDKVNQKLGPRQWEPLLYLSFSSFLRFDERREQQFLKCAELLLKKGADPNAFFMSGDEKETVLYGAAGVVNNAGLVKLLLDAGANPEDEEVYYHVAEFDNLVCFRLLNEAGISDDAKATMLLRKLDFESPDSVRFLLDLGFNPENRGKWGKTALHQAIMRGRSREIIQMLLDAGSDANARTDSGKTPLSMAVRRGRQDVFRLLLQYGADDNLSINDRFIGACMRADRPAVQAIRMNYPLVIANLSDHDRAAICTAAAQGKAGAVELMLEAGIKVNSRDEEGATALHWAAWHARPKAAAVLLEAGASVSSPDLRHNCTPLEWALLGSMKNIGEQQDYQQVVQQLIKAGSEFSDRFPGNPMVRKILNNYAAGN